MAVAGDGKPADDGHFLASDTDREQVIDTLKTAFVQGRLTKDELDARAGQAFTSRTYAELATVTADIPAGTPPGRKPAGTPPGRKPAGTRVAKKVAAGLGTAAGLSVTTIAIALLARNVELAAWGALLMFLAVLVAIAAGMVAVGNMVDSRLKNPRPSEQLPPGPGAGPGPGGPGPDHTGIGDQQVRPRIRRDETSMELRTLGSRRDRARRVSPAARPLAGLG
jgi:hypothetical protein